MMNLFFVVPASRRRIVERYQSASQLLIYQHQFVLKRIRRIKAQGPLSFPVKWEQFVSLLSRQFYGRPDGFRL